MFKNIILLYFLVTTMNNVYTTPLIISLIAETYPISGMVSNQPYKMLIDSVSYSKGGLVYSFPTGVFSQAPQIIVTPQWNSYVSGIAFSPVVTAITSTSCTIRVNKSGLLGLLFVTVVEADNNDVTLTIQAIGS